MEHHREQRQESHGVHVCNKCGWPFPNPHPNPKHRRAHKRICGTIEGFKLVVESEANNLLILSDDDGNQKSSSPKVLGGSCDDKGVDGIKKKSKESEDEVFSDAVAEFSEGVGPGKFVGGALDSVGSLKMGAEDDVNSSRTSKDREVLVIAETTISQSGSEQENKINQEFVNLETDSGTPLSSSSAENQKVENLIVAETSIDRSGDEQENKVDQLLVNLETNTKTGDSVVPSNDHMNSATTTSDLYPFEPESIIPHPQQEWNVDSVEKLAEIASSSEEMDNDKSKPLPKMEETIEIPTEQPFAHNGTSQSAADDDMSIHSETSPSVVVSDVKSVDVAQVASDTRKEQVSCSSNNLQETDKIKEENDNVHLSSMLSDLKVVDRPEALVQDSKDHRDVNLTYCVVQGPRTGDSEDNFKDPIPKESYATLHADPLDRASEVASFDSKIGKNRQKQGSGGNNAVDRNNDGEAEESPIQEVNAAQIKAIPGENEKHDQNQILSDASKFGIDGIPSASFSPEVESVAPAKNSPDNLSENVTEVFNENSMAAPTDGQNKFDDNEVGRGGILLADDENNAKARDRNSEDISLPVNAHERKDNGIGEKDKFDNMDIAGIEVKKDPSKEKLSIEIDSTAESTTNSRGNECIAVAEATADESPRKISVTESTDSKKFNISLASDTQESVKEDDHRDLNSVQNASDIHANQEENLVSVSNESVTGRSDASQDGSVSQLVGDALRIASETWKDDGVKIDGKQQLTPSLLDASVDACSRTESLEGNWGSVSVLSTQSDLPAVVDGEVTRQAQAEAEESDSRMADATTERQHSDRSDLFEAPSFMTLVEPNDGGLQNAAASEIQTAQNRRQPNSAPLQAGWFPSSTHIANDSPGRKKNEAIIAKVTNWSTGKPHTALKNLLDDAALENKQKSPTRKVNLASMIQKDEKSTKNGSVDKTVYSATRPKSPTSPLVNKEIANEWNSPARYPSDIRRERRKGKPYWAQFVCCSSVH